MVLRDVGTVDEVDVLTRALATVFRLEFGRAREDLVLWHEGLGIRAGQASHDTRVLTDFTGA